MPPSNEPHQGISDALLTLNLLGHVVDRHGALHVDGETVVLRVEGGTLIAIVGGATIPWRTFRQVLKPLNGDRR